MSIERKVQEALAMGVPMKEINRVLQGNAMKSKDPMVRQQLMNAGGAIYRQSGGTTSFGVGPVNVNVPRHHKVGPASIDLGGPIGGRGAGPRDQALAARNSRVGGAMVGGGLRTVGGVQQNLAGGIGQAGLKNRAFTPTSALEGVAGAAEARGQADAAYQDRLAQISGDEAKVAREDALREEKAAQEEKSKGDEESKASKDLIKLSNEAGGLIQEAAVAADIINGHTIVAEVETAVEEQGSKLAQLWDSTKDKAATGLNVLAGGLSQTDRIRAEARDRYAYKTYPQSYSAYTRLQAIANKMVFPILATGALGVNPTDADVELAKSSQFNVSAPSTTWASQLNALIERNGGTGNIPEVRKTSTPQVTRGSDDRSAGPRNTDSAFNPTGQEGSETALGLKGKDTFNSLKDKFLTNNGKTEAPSSTFPDEAPLGDRKVAKLSKTLEKTLNSKLPAKGKVKAIKAWMKLNKHSPDMYVTYQGKTGTIGGLIEAFGGSV